MYPKVEHVQLLDTMQKEVDFGSGCRRYVESSVNTAATSRILRVERLHVDSVERQ